MLSVTPVNGQHSDSFCCTSGSLAIQISSHIPQYSTYCQRRGPFRESIYIPFPQEYFVVYSYVLIKDTDLLVDGSFTRASDSVFIQRKIRRLPFACKGTRSAPNVVTFSTVPLLHNRRKPFQYVVQYYCTQ